MSGTASGLTAKPITLVGAGSMGRLIGLTLATRGGTVRLYDTNPEALAAAAGFIAAELPGLVEVLSAKGDGYAVGTVETHDDLAAALADAGFVVEAVPEDAELKRTVLANLDELADPEAIVASNSSSFPVAAFRQHLNHSERVLNVHFHNPPHAPAVDLLSSGETKPEILALLKAELPRYGLVPFEAGTADSGFPFNRLLEALFREALQIVADGASTPEQVDAMWVVDTGMPWGPFALMDMVGLDVVADIENGRRSQHPTLAQWDAVETIQPYLDAGKLGCKSGEGFFRYDATGQRQD